MSVAQSRPLELLVVVFVLVVLVFGFVLSPFIIFVVVVIFIIIRGFEKRRHNNLISELRKY